MEPLHEVTTKYTFYELKRFFEFYRKINYYWLRVSSVVLVFAAVGGLVILSGETMIGVVLVLGAALGFAMLVLKSRSLVADAVEKSNLMDKTVTIIFCDNRITLDYDRNHFEFLHSEITKHYETDTDFYIFMGKRGGILIPKPDCSSELSDYIRTLKPKEQKQ